MVLSGLVVVFLGVGVPVSSAHWARAEATDSGTLTVDGRNYGTPGDCVTVRSVPRRLNIDNETALRANVYLFPGCKGGVTHVIEPGHTGTALGASIQTR
ncbi:hypothetical protein NSK11_contig00115-0004 [Nocardia seriolae]|uniref:Uncharacterized protein n=1 Tax=Nocardia seriolae TaxID=37332 RepID=A0ABC9Z122_9NOCA|nr:hypothetical protein C6575_02920 [Nocardia seriolae]GEM22603.1 hypothetical protein NS2_08420 [Nocardia seriolae NBRC 15557]RLP33147.1 hypothetical protein D6158_04355 [Nocardia seriolae]BAW05647.1 conserved hypothetical protein [Nocardia seriolae]BEK86945.1 hypothetical protein NSERKGN1266_28960 [Nocardia seriolae]